MNQRTDLGTSYLDIAKGAVELFLKVKGREGRDGKISRGGGGGVDLGDSVTSVLPFPPSFPSWAPLCHPSPAAARPGPSQPRRQVHAGHLRRTPVLHQGKGAIERVRRTRMGTSGLGQLPFLAPARAVLRRWRDVGVGGRRGGAEGWLSGAVGGFGASLAPGVRGGAALERNHRRAWPVAAATAVATEDGGHFAFVWAREGDCGRCWDGKEGEEGGEETRPFGVHPARLWPRGRASLRLRPRCSGPRGLPWSPGSTSGPSFLPPPDPRCFPSPPSLRCFFSAPPRPPPRFPPAPSAPFLLRAWPLLPGAFED